MRHRFWIALPILTVLLLGVDASAAAQSPEEAPSADTVATTDHYVFVSHPWLSLHHFLYQWARAENGGFQRYSVVERDSLARLSPTERDTWTRAVSFYADRITEYDLTHSDTMRAIRNQLRDTPPHPDSLGALPFDLHTTLRSAMQVYRTHWWPSHEALSRNWIQVVTERLRRQEDTLVSRIERAYGGSFPEDGARVFVTPYSNWAGAYATVRPLQISVAARRYTPTEAGAMETLVHETAHSTAFSWPLKSALREAFAAYDAEPPGRLWHAIIFYTSGEITRKYVAADTSFQHYGARYGLYDDAEWARWVEALDQHWRPFLNGTVERDRAYRRVAEALVSGGRGTSSPQKRNER
jgi:hypothetical protein